MVNANREDGIQYGINLHLASFGAIIKLVENSGSSSENSVAQVLIEVLKMLEKTTTSDFSIDKATLL